MLNNARYAGMFTPHRVDEFQVELLDRRDNVLGVLDGVTGGSIVASTDGRIKTGGKLSMVASEPVEWWADKRLKVWARANGQWWSLGVFLPTSPQMRHDGSNVTFTVELSDKLLVLEQDGAPAPVSIQPGTKLTTWVANYIRATGETKVNIESSTKTNKRALTWDAGTPKLTVINDVLDYIGYFSLSADPNGQYVASPYKVPAERPISWEMRQGENAWIEKSFVHEQDWDSVPNRVVYVAQSAATTVNGVIVEGQYSSPLIAVAENRNANSWASYQARGRWITHTSTDVEAESQSELQKKANRQLEQLMEPYAKIEMNALLLPLRLNELVHFISEDYNLVGAVRRTEISLTPGSLMKVVLRKSNYDLN